MSTHTHVTGEVTLDAAALGALQARATWDWVEGGGDEGITLTPSGTGSTLSFDGSLQRNLGRYLGPDLAAVAAAGEVRGKVTLDCQDGCHEREVLELDHEGTWSGRSECLNEAVEAVLVTPEELQLGGRSLLTLLAPVPGSRTRVLTGAEPPTPCGCRGWDEEPSCWRERPPVDVVAVQETDGEDEDESATPTTGGGHGPSGTGEGTSTLLA